MIQTQLAVLKQAAALRPSPRELDCLAAAVYYEARGESAEGQAAVAQVVLNRMRTRSFPKSACGVVYQGAGTGDCQFSFACGAPARPEGRAWVMAHRVALRALGGYVMTGVGRATSFHCAGLGDGWGPGLIRVARIGGQVFFAAAGRTLRAGAGASSNPTLS
jgi:spore germination cell wall hydrolase CwlJ-like protein